MNEIESPKETAGEPPKETPKVLEIPKGTKTQKFYKVCGLIQNILFGIFFIYTLYDFGRFEITRSERFYGDSGLSTMSYFLFIIIFLANALLIIFGISLYFINRNNNIRKTYGSKFILRGIVGLTLSFGIYFIITFLVSLFVPVPRSLPSLLQ